MLHVRMESAFAYNNWRSSAAYLYILELDRIDLAWEYLRRNPAYRKQWIEAADADPAAPADAWHCRHFIDPALDARSAFPEWLPAPVFPLRLVPGEGDSSALKFSLWRIPGRKKLRRTASGYLLETRIGRTVWRLSLSPRIRDQSVVAFQVCAGLKHDSATSLLTRISAALASEASPVASTSAASWRPKHELVMHMRVLIALDGVAAGASHRAIAESIYGVEDVWRRWGKYSELPSHIRYLLRRGRALVDGGYHHLLTHPESQF